MCLCEGGRVCVCVMCTCGSVWCVCVCHSVCARTSVSVECAHFLSTGFDGLGTQLSVKQKSLT